MHDLAFQAVELLGPVVLALLGWLAVKLSTYINAKARNAYLQDSLHRLADTVFTVVQEIGQTFVDDIKAGRADGKLTPDEVATANQRALSAVKAYYGPHGLAELARVLGLDSSLIDKFLLSRIESAVRSEKAVASPN